jgi:excisionase family DNA binding protein
MNATKGWLELLSHEVETAPLELLEETAADLERARIRVLRRIAATSAPAPKNGNGEELLTPEEVAERLKVAKPYVYDLCRRGDLPSVPVGPRYVRIPRRAFEEYVRARERRREGA